MNNVSTRDYSPAEAGYFSDLSFEDDIDEEGIELDPLDPFFADGTITDVLGELKSGKEGTVFLCRANSSTGHELLAAKVYRARSERMFRNDSVYAEGRSYGKARENRAVKNKSRIGRQFQYGEWLYHEWETLGVLWRAGASVPQPVARGDNAILMQFIGDGERAAPALQGAHLEAEEVRPLFSQLMNNIELFLRCNYVHGDLSPYNVLYERGEITIIDFPQAVDPRENSHALDLLRRDVERICSYFMRYGMNVNPNRIAEHLWSRFLRMDL